MCQQRKEVLNCLLFQSRVFRSVLLILKPISYFLSFIWLDFFLSRNCWSLSDYDLIASIWEQAISILAGNLNSGHGYLLQLHMEASMEVRDQVIGEVICTNLSYNLPSSKYNFQIRIHVLWEANFISGVNKDYMSMT